MKGRPSTDDGLDRDEAELIERRGDLEITLSDEGHEVWDRQASPSEPLARFPRGDSGFENAYGSFSGLSRGRRFAKIRRRTKTAAFWTALVSGAIWVVTTGIFHVRIYMIGDPFGSAAAYNAVQWMNSLSVVTRALFFFGFGTFVLFRLSDERPPL